MENKLAISAIILMIAGFTYFGISTQEANYYCPNKEIKAYCYDFSSTGKTCYTIPETKRTGGKRCDEPWKEIPFITSEVPLEISSYSISSKKIHCTSLGCS